MSTSQITISKITDPHKQNFSIASSNFKLQSHKISP